MSEDKPLVKHEKQISNWTGGYIVAIAILIFHTWDNNVLFLDFIENLTGVTDKFVDDLISYAALGAVAFVIGKCLTAVRLHNYLDHLFWKTRKDVDKYIVDELSAVFQTSITNPNKQLTHNDFMNIFYDFVGQDDDKINRSRAFSYWARYYVSINFVALSLVGYSIFYLLIILGNKIESYIALTVFLIFCSVGLLSFIGYLSLKPKLKEKIAKPQVKKITTIKRNDLIAVFNSLANPN